jgi:DNA polymerase I-like protein with 3'-5' exonuclease and polymerase domains
VQHCIKTHVEPVLRARPWRRIDIFGDKPLKFLVGKDEGITKWRGSPLPIPILGEKPICIPTLHPAFVARTQEMFPVVVNDLSKSLITPPEHYNLYPSLADLRDFTATEFAFDIETNGWTQEITLVGICDKPFHVLVVPFRGQYVDELKRIFANAKSVIGHNSLQFDLPVLRKSGVLVAEDCELWDTMLLQHLRFPSLPHDLEFVGSQFSNKPAWKHQKASLELYNARDVDVTMQAFQQLKPLCEQSKVMDLYRYVQVPLAKICHLMQTTGFKVDPGHIAEVRTRLEKQVKEEETFLPDQLRTRTIKVNKREVAPPGTLSAKTGKPLKYISVEAEKAIVPWRSTDWKKRYLYGVDEPWQLGFEEQLDPKKGTVTTGKNALDKLSNRLTKEAAKAKTDEERNLLLAKARQLSALKNLNKWDELLTTFCTEDMAKGKVERMHPHFNVHGTASGRFSSSDPNLQNIPESVRIMYVASEPGWKIIEFDFSQIENRLTGFFANDRDRLARWEDNPGFSEHKYLASLILGVPYDEVKKSADPESPYIRAKKVVHGTNYGEGPAMIAKMNDLDLKEVKKTQALWKDQIRATIQWQERVTEQAKRDGYLTTPFGRKRWFYTDRYYTESLSFLPQSTAADCIFRAMIGLMYERIGWPLDKALRVVRLAEPLPHPARLLLQVHDSLVFECPEAMVPELVRVVKKVMEQPWPELLGFTIPVACKVGDSWGEAEDYK